jgi:signal transduction histidine kinase
MERIHRIKALTTLIAVLPYTIVDVVTQRSGICYLWFDNVAAILTSIYALLYFFYLPVRAFSKRVFLGNSFCMLLYIAIYSYHSPGWPMYSASILLWAFFYAVFESKKDAIRSVVFPFLVVVLVYNSYFQTELTSTLRWEQPSFTLSRVGTALFFAMSIAMISFLSDEYQRINVNRLQSKESKISFQNDLFSILSHNIRTPLATLTMQLQLAKMREQEMIEREKIELPLKQLELTINALLDNRKAMKSESKLSLNELIKELQSLHKTLIIENSDLFDRDIDVEFGLVMAIDSFVTNALKYDSSPTLIISGTPELVFTLSDHGGGMSSSDFQEYGNPVVSKSRGLGIGVHLSKEILTHLGYRCEVGNTEHLGITIRIYRPSQHMANMKALEHSHMKLLC